MKKTSLAAVIALFAVFVASSASAALCGAGDRAQVLWKGTWYPASVQRVSDDGQKCFIHYDGYGSNWDEWVGSDRIKVAGASAPAAAPAAAFKAGDSVQVNWKGSWWNASVLQVLGGGRYRIHYDGYDSSWDENVGPSRIRPR
ncbi:MAG TPA: Tudor-knot domain-containing protein [bacterium]|nr:Tudor-knot domain-containing protein [bacterium]